MLLSAKIAVCHQRHECCGLAHESHKMSFDLREKTIGSRVNRHHILFVVEGHDVVVLRIRHSSQQDVTKAELER